MNRNKLKAYAPQARRDFIKAVTDRAAYYGLMHDKIEPVTEQGDVAIIAGKPFPRAVAAKRKRLEERIRLQGFDQVMEAMAYTWFNRFVAIRFMELHGYLDHGYRVLTHPEDNATPEIVEHAEHIDLPRLDREKVIELKLDGTKEAELYRMLLVAQCNALHKAMPFLFEWVDDETELLLPDNPLHSDSVIRKLVNEIPDDDWQEVEIIGWLYQFYISEKKDQVIGKVVKSEDIPAATQLFTPNWIVKYMVQNTLGRQWMATYPNSTLKEKMEFYIEPAKQTPEVQEQLKAITPDNLNPEELTLLDPACGSGHILVEAYDLLKAIYQERGYRAKDIPRLILEKNLYGLEIDDRAAQLAAFAMMMKARSDDRRIFGNGVRPHVLAIQESKSLKAKEITEALNAPILKVKLPPREMLFEEMEEARAPLFSRKNLSIKGEISQTDVAQLIDLFENGKTFGSLIRVPEKLANKLPAMAEWVEDVLTYGELFGQAAARSLMPLIEQARILASIYDAVVTNPPYLSQKGGMNPELKAFAKRHFPDSKADLFSMFLERMLDNCRLGGCLALVAPYVWMFLSSFKMFRRLVLDKAPITSLVQLEYNAFEPACVPVATFSMWHVNCDGLIGDYISLREFKGHENQAPKTREAISQDNCPWRFEVDGGEFRKIPGTPIAYETSDNVRAAFSSSDLLSDFGKACSGIQTGDNDRFLRLWYEVDFKTIGFSLPSRKAAADSRFCWFPHKKGGPFRKWYGNCDFVINWKDDGNEIKKHPSSSPKNLDYMFREAVTWSHTSSASFSARYSEPGSTFNVEGPSYFSNSPLTALAYLCSKPCFEFMKLVNPTMHFLAGNVANLPWDEEWADEARDEIEPLVREAIAIAKADWNSLETSWLFVTHPLLSPECKRATIEAAFHAWSELCASRVARLKVLEETNNRIFIEVFQLVDEFSPVVCEDKITLTRLDQGGVIKTLVQYSLGCILGRYSLDVFGLVYAGSGNNDFDSGQYTTCEADVDGIIPITDTAWFEDDATERIAEFVAVAWPRENLTENLAFIANSLGSKRGESPKDTIRRYLLQGFYKDHLHMYKGPKHPPRPIYWVFSSGKERAFQCLVYLHRYNEGTLSRMRTEYVIPLQGKINARIDQLKDDITAATSTSHRKKLERERDKLVKQQTELQTFDEKLRHYAGQRISLDLDDGVKVNYGKFGDLLAEVKAVTGRKPND